MNSTVRNETAVADGALFEPGLYESYALEKEGPMTETERQILDGLADLNTKLNGRNGDKGVLTRLALLEDKTGDRAILMRQVKAGVILMLISAVLAFVAARITFQQTPTKDDTEQRIQKLEAELIQTRQALKDREEAVRVLIEQQMPQPKRSTRPRRPTAAPEPQRLNRLRDEVTATNPLPTLGAMRFPHEAPPFN